jgi:phosphotriesterase-related protein
VTPAAVQTFGGAVPGDQLGVTLAHEHVFVGHPELDRNFPHPEWDEQAAIDGAVAGLEELWDLGVRTVVDLTVLGLGRDVARVAEVAPHTRVNLLAATGYYTADVLPAFFQTHGPGLLVDGPDPLVEFFLRDIEEGIAGTGVRAAALKVVTDRPGLTPDVQRVLAAAAEAHVRTGVPVFTHTHAPSQNGREQLAFLGERGVAPERIVVGHCGDTEELDYLRELMDAGATIGMDRFGMEHVLPDDRRVATVLALLAEGYADRMLLSHDAAFFSRVTPPSWRAEHAPHWNMLNLSRRVLPMLREGGATEDDLHQLMVLNPARVLVPSKAGSAR